MPYKLVVVAVALSVVCLPAVAQNTWTAGYKLELRADYRWSDDETHPNPLNPDDENFNFRTPDPGSHVELNVADVQLDLGYGEWFAARAKVHFEAKHRRNPTSTDRQVDADELYVRFGPYPEFLARPSGTSVFLQAGKFPKMERQPVRLLESYGLAATSFNRFEDTQIMLGGTIGRSLYWRAVVANGNPVFFRDPNALAGDNGTDARFVPPHVTEFGSGFPILYNAETEDLLFKTENENVQTGGAAGYRWQREDQTAGFDAIVFHYQRDLADRAELTGTRYGGDLDLFVVTPAEVPLISKPVMLPIEGRRKTETGVRVYGEWHGGTVVAQYTTQTVAGLEREGWELEAGYRFPLNLGWVESIQPAVRVSAIDNHFGPSPPFPAASLWWDWRKYDAGARIGLRHGLDVTVEATQHHVDSKAPLHLREALVTVRWKI